MYPFISDLQLLGENYSSVGRIAEAYTNLQLLHSILSGNVSLCK